MVPVLSSSACVAPTLLFYTVKDVTSTQPCSLMLNLDLSFDLLNHTTLSLVVMADKLIVCEFS